MMVRADGHGVMLVGLLGRPGAEACPNLLQRRPATGSAADESAEYQRFFSRAPTRLGSLQQIWTNDAATGHSEGRRGSNGDLAGRVAVPGILGVVAIPAGPLAGGPEARGRPRRIVCYAPSPSAVREKEA